MDEPDPVGATTIEVLEGAALVDTVGARLVQPIVGRVLRASGTGIAGAEVNVAVEPRAARVSLRNTVDGPSEGSGTLLVTDDQGRFEFYVELWIVSGTATVTMTPVRQPFPTSSQVEVEVLPGVPSAVNLGQVPELLTIGDSIILRGQVQDVHGNDTGGTVAYSVDGAAHVTEGVLTASDWGPLTVVGQAGDLADSVQVLSLPAGRILIPTRSDGILAIGLDGGSIDALDLADTPGDATSDPSGERAAYGYRGALYVTDFETTVQITGSSPYRAASLPRYAPDGSVIYFVAEFTDRGAEVWEISPDGGTVLERVTEVPVLGNADRHPAPSNGGDRLSFSRTVGGSLSGPLMIRDLGSTVESPVGVDAQSSRWSPDDTWIAYLTPGDEIRRIRPDGSGDEPILTGAQFYKNFAWTPDGRFLIAAERVVRRLHLVEVATGESLVLPFPYPAAGVDWYPHP